jgi:hypothetical protein
MHGVVFASIQNSLFCGKSRQRIGDLTGFLNKNNADFGSINP